MADDDSGEVAPSTSIPTTTSATTVGATPTTALGDEEEEEPKPRPGKKRSASSAKKVKKEAESNGASGESADGGKQLYTYVKISCVKRQSRDITILFLYFLHVLVYV